MKNTLVILFTYIFVCVSCGQMQKETINCNEFKKHDYNGFYLSSDTGKDFVLEESEFQKREVIKCNKIPDLSFSLLKSVKQDTERGNSKFLVLEFNEKGKVLLNEITTNNTQKNMGVIIDDKLVMAPLIRDPISEGIVHIVGNFTSEEITMLEKSLNRIVKCTNKN